MIPCKVDYVSNGINIAGVIGADGDWQCAKGVVNVDAAGNLPTRTRNEQMNMLCPALNKVADSR